MLIQEIQEIAVFGQDDRVRLASSSEDFEVPSVSKPDTGQGSGFDLEFSSDPLGQTR